MNKTAILLVTLLLLSLYSYLSFEHVQAAYQGYSNLGTFDFNDLASSLKVRGTAYIYENIDYGGTSKYFSTIDVPSLNAYGWNDKMSSLTVDGSITLYEHDNYGGRTVTFVSTPDSNENLGNYWSTNPSLVKTQGKWDSRIWGWDTSYLELLGSDTDNYVNWISDGLVSSQCKDSQSRPRWGVCNFDQGYSLDQRWIPDLRASSQQDSGIIGDYVRSLKLQGTVTLYENVNYGGASITIGPYYGTQGWIPDLAVYGWNRPTRSLHLYDGSTLTVYSLTNYIHAPSHGFGMLTFATPAYQPPLLRIGDVASMTLEGSVKDWYTDGLGYGSCSWTGAKFDIWAVENPSRPLNGRKLMLELYFVRMGMNLWWGNAIAKPGLNKMVAIDCYPESVQRTVHPGNVQRWKIDALRFLTDCAGDYGIDIWSWYLAQISFDVESGSSLPFCETPVCGCSLTKFRMCYTNPTGGGGCPYAYSWNGQQYVEDNNIMPASEMNNGTDTKDYYKLEQPLVPTCQDTQFSLYSLQIREFEHEHDYIDQVKLMAIDHSRGTRIAVTPEGKIVTYKNPASPLSCVDNHENNRLKEISKMDGDVSDPATFFQGFKDDWLILNFGHTTSSDAKLILRDDQKCADVCINVQVPDVNGNWQTVEVLHPRDYWAMEAVDLAAYVPRNGDFLVRLLWTAPHRLDYVGLDTSPPTRTTLSTASPVFAAHSSLGDVTARLLLDDEKYAELINGQRITIMFMLSNKEQGASRDFILYTNGYYYVITS
jgi:hypothetical protein